MVQRRCRYCERVFQPSKFQPRQSVCSEDHSIPEAALSTLWNMDIIDVQDITDNLVDMSLAIRTEDRRLHIHDLLLDYLRHSENASEEEMIREQRMTNAPKHAATGPARRLSKVFRGSILGTFRSIASELSM